MSKRTLDALRRADRALAGALVLSLVTAGAAAEIRSHTDELSAPHSSVLQEAVAKAAPPAIALQSDVIASAPTAKVLIIPTSAEEIAALRLVAAENCLAQAMYYEARGEGREGEEAIAEVVFHRMHAAGYPGTICGVVHQGAHSGHGCQFSFACDGELDHARSPGAWAEARRLAVRILSGGMALGNTTDGAIAFHAEDVTPDWAGVMAETVQIGRHIFYRRLPHTQSS
jgi:spore germination cell wall hydrolase CwlJ-like protein